MGVETLLDFTELAAVIIEATADKEIRKQARSFTEAAKATDSSAGLFRAWREETQYTHATGKLAITYAPSNDGKFGFGKPFVPDLDLGILLMTMLLTLTLAVKILMEERTPQHIIDSLFDAFFDGLRAAL